MKKIILIFCSLFLFIPGEYAGVDDACEAKKGFDLYTCRVKTICEGKAFDSKKPLFQTQKYENAEGFKGIGGINQEAYKAAQKNYKSNMSGIYKCATLSAQKIALKKVKNLLKADKTGILEDDIGREIELKMQKNELTSSTIGCKNPDDTNIYNKLNVLNETTFEICKYVTYLEYLKIYYAEIGNLVEKDPNAAPDQEVRYPATTLSREVFGIAGKLDLEIVRTYKVASTVFHAYAEYENNLAIHLFLQLIKRDYIAIRDNLYKVINPINQVLYKISNAMQK